MKGWSVIVRVWCHFLPMRRFGQITACANAITRRLTSAFVRILGFTSGNLIWWGNQRENPLRYCWASLPVLEDDVSLLQTDYNEKNIHKCLCEFLFQKDMRSVRTAASLLLLICYITVILLAPLCTGQGKAPLSLLQRAQKCLLWVRVRWVSHVITRCQKRS